MHGIYLFTNIASLNIKYVVFFSGLSCAMCIHYPVTQSVSYFGSYNSVQWAALSQGSGRALSCSGAVSCGQQWVTCVIHRHHNHNITHTAPLRVCNHYLYNVGFLEHQFYCNLIMCLLAITFLQSISASYLDPSID